MRVEPEETPHYIMTAPEDWVLDIEVYWPYQGGRMSSLIGYKWVTLQYSEALRIWGRSMLLAIRKRMMGFAVMLF